MNRFQKCKAAGAAVMLAGFLAAQMALAPFLLAADQDRSRSGEVTHVAMSSSNWGWG